MFEEPGESAQCAHLCSSVLLLLLLHLIGIEQYSIRIRIVAADLIRDSIRTKISDSQVPTNLLNE